METVASAFSLAPLTGQFAYLLFFLSFASWSTKGIRIFATIGSIAGMIFSFKAESEPLLVPLVWHFCFFIINVSYFVVGAIRDRSRKLDPLETFLKNHVFPQLSSGDLKELVGMSSEGLVQKGNYIAKSGAPIAEVSCILTGLASASDQGEKKFEMKPGRLIGERILLDESNFRYDLNAITDVILCVWEVSAIQKWLKGDISRTRVLQAAIGTQLVAEIIALKNPNRSSERQTSTNLTRPPPGRTA